VEVKYTGVMTAPVYGSGSVPACTASVCHFMGQRYRQRSDSTQNRGYLLNVEKRAFALRFDVR
jgi:hypothetical protein